MFTLTKNGELVRMKNGSPFIYSDMRLARLGRKILAARLKTKLNIVEVNP